ncbi:DUF808 domain-containing protein [Caulobacter segnis]|uniref:DUF808 domain-containing protein n=1 Tax=Caulobacter segnis TaxID=88688 RepID=UPI00240FDB08|nr:DUF808 domain-containing protein [Caulobacter segnis]MDG2521301.1 DUF808 domain-containing protein [Caulobacter segnis]
MASGLVALLDDVAGIAKIAAASVDDIGAAAGKAGSKAVGVVIDDTAVTPGYAVGFTPDRELPIVAKIAIGSIRNKLIFLLPGALLLSAFAPWAVTPILMCGGAYLCFEAAEKIIEKILPHAEHDETEGLALSAKDLENEKVSGAIRTDLILSGEIMAIALSEVSDMSLPVQAAALAVVALAITVIVYGAVAFIVKMDDIGLHLAQRNSAPVKAFGRGMVKAMPVILKALTYIGTLAMLWVGGGILVHGLDHFGVSAIEHGVEALSHAAAVAPGIGPITGWAAMAAAYGVFGLVVGSVIAGIVHLIPKRKKAA